MNPILKKSLILTLYIEAGLIAASYLFYLANGQGHYGVFLFVGLHIFGAFVGELIYGTLSMLSYNNSLLVILAAYFGITTHLAFILYISHSIINFKEYLKAKKHSSEKHPPQESTIP